MKLRRGVGWQHDLRMNNAALMRVVMGHAVPLVHQPFTTSVSGSGYGRFADTAFDDLDGTMKNGYAGLPPFGVLMA